MVLVKVHEGENFEQAIKRFKKKCQRAGILSEVRRRQFYVKPSVKRKIKSLKAQRRRK